MPVTAQDVAAARPAVERIARRTPVLTSRTFSERFGGAVSVKAENLQRTGSFKVRGAAAKLAALGDACSRGVVCASAGNHGQGVAAAAAALGYACEVFVPDDASIGKFDAMTSQGAKVEFGGATVDDCLEVALARSEEAGLCFVHPFDDADVVAGQGSIGLELIEDVPDLGTVIVPVGGGGLASGVALAVKSARPEVRVIGVQASACAPFAESLRSGVSQPAETALTIADGIAVKRPGELTLQLLGQWMDDLVVVGEDEIAAAMVLLLERAKLVVEGAGAVGVAALLGGQVTPKGEGTTVAILSGGNVDVTLLASVARRYETEAGRRLVLFTKLPDRPGALVDLLSHVATTGANIVDVQHVREGVDLHVRETMVELVLETRGREHAVRVNGELQSAGYETRVVR
jgi:threonine dehydratase